MQDPDQIINSQKTRYNSNSRVSDGVSFVSILEKKIVL